MKVFKFRASLPGIKGFTRVYEVKDGTTLYSFHKQMRADMDFPQDQMVLFKALDADGAVKARYGIFDLGSGTIDSVTIGQTVKEGVTSFVYFYDTTNVKSIILTFEGETEAQPGTVYPALVESKGPNPIEFENGYVAFEDLPDDKRRPPVADDQDGGSDDDDDIDLDEDDEDEDGDDDTEEIYDEDEENDF